MNYLKTLNDQIHEMAKGLIQALPSLGIAMVILIVTWLVARSAAHVADRVTAHAHMRAALKQLVETLVRLGIWLVGILIAATVAVPGLTPAGLFAGLGVGAVAIGFAFQDIFQNFLAGVLIMIREKMRIGDVIECENIVGRVEKITLRETHIRALSNELTIVPNTLLFKNPVKILTDKELRRAEIVVGVSYDTDLDAAAKVIQDAVERTELVLNDKGVEVYAREFGASSIDFLVRFWSKSTPKDVWQAKNAVVRAVKRALDDAGIEIPFPYVTNTFKEALPLVRARNSASAGVGAGTDAPDDAA